MKGGGGGLFSSSQTANTTQNQTRDLRSFAPFQQPAIQTVFDALQNPALLQTDPRIAAGLYDALGFATGQLGQAARFPATGDLRSVIDIAKQDISAQPYNDVIDRFEGIGNRARDIFASEIARDPTTRVIDYLTPTARGDFLGANPYFQRGVLDPAEAAARNSVASIFSGAGTLNSSAAPQAIAREVGRTTGALAAQNYATERAQQLGAQNAIGGFDTNEAIRRLNALTTSNNIQLQAAQGVLSGTSAEQQRRANLLGLTSNAASNLGSLQNQVLPYIPQIAQQAAQLPFIPLTNYSNIAFQPLGQTGTINTVGTTEQTNTPSPFQTLAGLGLTAAGAFGGGGFGGVGKGATAGTSGIAPFGMVSNGFNGIGLPSGGIPVPLISGPSSTALSLTGPRFLY